MTENNVLAIDCDGVKLDYNATYPRVWRAAFGSDLPRVRDNCYHASNEYGVAFRDQAQKEQFFDAFDDRFWSTMEPLEGAVEGAKLLSAASWRIVCVSSMPKKYAGARHQNLQKLGFPVERVIATGRGDDHRNPKLDAIADLQPAAFVDDLLENFDGISERVHRAWVDYQNVDSPNRGLEGKYPHDSVHRSLFEFAAWWTQHRRLPAF
ncbi:MULTISPECIES: HAD family hydrolase [unclassified Variovorax]|uniref:HAD family hydrolase n=1 Tax=unclassified Variovorax TaxID=663243 RepID=UPI0013168958|nr:MULTISPECIES: HAD family hydrolase [unclassified Variovorax]VTU42695.1 5' nucleotidase, deoxy (Pyrimidine), cytosolic type C protein (NT5C) [Variovorax sp. PBL-H6]VTU43744.1 5' nucleotidase, deoxy (Pyrimidine), cytosolic type C protein (NT5C) [Variovorax sp. SRS16]VTU43810.1 5' nucleotidase, deoxy (Pyrimidine), cytosolic type C protein (NT5C) [Variovorax sp. PBL-E5]